MRLPSVRSRLRVLALITAAAPLAAASVVAQPITAGAAGGQTRQLPRVGTTTFLPTPEGTGALSFPEIAGAGGDAASPSPNVKIVDRHQSVGEGQGQDGGNGQNQDRPATLVKSFDGLRHRDQRLANGGNQFSVEPPDQGLCVGNGFVMETVNDVLTVYDLNGNRLKGVTDLNTFYGYPPAVLRKTPRVYGPFVTDPSCHFDPDTQRWIHVVLTLETFPTSGFFTGSNHLDIAVSDTSSPLGNWTIYRIDTTDDGTNGTPNHHCSSGPNPVPPTHPTACIGDYPHMGADHYGVFFTTNEYSLFGPEFKSANIYAVSKRALTSRTATISATQFETVGAVHLSSGQSESGFTVWPATSPDQQYAGSANGTEFFMSSDAASEVNSAGTSNRLIVWSITNTHSLDATPDLRLNNTVLPVRPYAIPPLSDQKPGNVPLAECINDTALPTPAALGLGGPGCWRFLFTNEPAHNMVETRLDSNDTRMQQVTYANGRLWGALDTALTLGGVNKAGIEWFIVRPRAGGEELEAEVDRQGYLGVPGNNVTYPAIGVTSHGRGVMGFTLVGKDHYPSAGYSAIDSKGVGKVQVAAEGLGPEDGFTGYAPLVAPNPVRPRWGDYGAAVPVGNDVWIANEYIGQTCDLATYYAGGDPTRFGSCGGTRTALANWYTRISRVRV
jgi:hypothetical protein